MRHLEQHPGESQLRHTTDLLSKSAHSSMHISESQQDFCRMLDEKNGKFPHEFLSFGTYRLIEDDKGNTKFIAAII